jgi:hypothetical protein
LCTLIVKYLEWGGSGIGLLSSDLTSLWVLGGGYIYTSSKSKLRFIIGLGCEYGNLNLDPHQNLLLWKPPQSCLLDARSIPLSPPDIEINAWEL